MNQISTTSYFKKGWAIVKANLFKIIGATAVLFIIQALLDSFSKGHEKNDMALSMEPLSLLATIVSLVVGVAVTSATIKIVRGAPVDMKALSITPTQVLRYIGVVVLLAFIFLAFVIPFAITAGIAFGASSLVSSFTFDAKIIPLLIILILAVICLVYLQTRLMFATYLVIDGKAGVFESIKKSWSMTQGKVWFLVLFALEAIVIAIFGILALLVGLLVAIPVIMFASGYLYVSFADGSEKKIVEAKE